MLNLVHAAATLRPDPALCQRGGEEEIVASRRNLNKEGELTALGSVNRGVLV
jgi:hypothetical protein